MLNSIKITDITKTKKGLNALFCENGFLFSVDDMLLAQEKITTGSCFTGQELSLLYEKSTTNKAVQKAYNLLSYRSHSKRELYTKLCKNFDSQCAQAACDKMEELGFINDQSYCEAKTEYLILTKKCSLGETRAKLLTLGINKDIIESCIALYDSETQADNLRALIGKKYKSKLDNPQKVVAALMRKGFSYYDIKSALKEFEIETEDDF
ncbi:MAG: RecX family transcriptional regulator [Oscillospiraceae bacterium]|nr:RecX family transcriptional regulator [Oscillospiraceae bacterium]